MDTHELWIQESEPTPCTMSALGQFGAEMLKLSRGLQEAATAAAVENMGSAGMEARLLTGKSFLKSG